MTKKIKQIIMACGDGTFNLGDEAIFASFVDNLEGMLEEGTTLNIKVFSNNPKKTLKLHGERKSTEKNYKNVKINIKTIDVDMSITSWLWNFPKIIREFSKTDLLVWGGGNLITDGPSYLYTPYHLLKIYLAKSFDKKVIVYGIGVEPLTTKLSKYLTRTALNKADIISVRDRWSKKLLRRYGVVKPIFVTVDPAFDLNHVESSIAKTALKYDEYNEKGRKGDKEKKHPLIAICPRQVFHRKTKGLANLLPIRYRLKLGMIDENEIKRFIKFEKNLAKAADYLVDRFNARIVFIPMQMSKTQKQQDETVCSEIINMMKNRNSTMMLNSEKYTPKELKGIYGLMDMVIAVRFHALVLGAGMNVPTLSVPYSPKGKRLTKMLGLEVYSLPAEDAAENSEKAIIERINNIFANKDEIVKNLRAKNRDFSEMAKFNVMLVDSLLRR